MELGRGEFVGGWWGCILKHSKKNGDVDGMCWMECDVD